MNLVTLQFEPTAVHSGTGSPIVREFISFGQWVNKAPTWVRRGDTLVDAEGRVVRNGADAKVAVYPVKILHLKGAAE